MSRTRDRSKKSFDMPTAPHWLLTYGDMVTLLLAFFILLVSFSSLQEAKFKNMINALQAALGVLGDRAPTLNYPTPPGEATEVSLERLEENMEAISTMVKNAGLGNEIDVVPTEGGYALRISSPVLFDQASADIKPAGMDMLERIATYLTRYRYRLRIEGHTDDVPIHTTVYPSNWELSTARALSVLKALASNGIAPERLAAAGYGEFKPLVDNDTEEHRGINRRVEIYVNVKSDEERITYEELIGR